MRLRLTVALGLAAIASVATLAIPSPASAGTNCEGGYHCAFFLYFTSAKHSYFNSDPDFSNDIFNQGGQTGRGFVVDDQTFSASNSSTGGYVSYWYNIANYQGYLFCIRPGSQVESLPEGERDRASSMKLSRNYWPPCY